MYRIWFQNFRKDGTLLGTGVSTTAYVRKGNAIRVAKRRYNNSPVATRWIVSQTNPF